MNKDFKNLLDESYKIKCKILKDKQKNLFPLGRGYYRGITTIIHILESLEDESFLK